MSNIGFMQNCAKNIERLYNSYMKNTKKIPSKAEKDEYIHLIEHLEIMLKRGEIEDVELYKKLMSKIKMYDLTTLVDDRKKIKKQSTGNNRTSNYSMLT